MGKCKRTPHKSDINANIAKILTLHRVWNGYTQKNIAQCIEVTFQQIQKYERGQNAISLNIAKKLCEYLDVSIDYFIKPMEDKNLTFLKRREANVYPFKKRFVENQANQSHE